MHRLSNMPEVGNRAGGFVEQYRCLGMALSFLYFGIGLESIGFLAIIEGQLCKVWDGLHIPPRTTPTKRAKLCRYAASIWFLRPSHMKTLPHFELPMPISRLQLLMQFRMGSHALPLKQDRLARPAIPGHLRHCALCQTHWEMSFGLDCPVLPTFAASIGHCTRALTISCSVSCGTRTKRLSAIASQRFSSSG